MKRLFVFFAFACLAMTHPLSQASAQVPVNYRIEQIPVENAYVNHMNNWGLVVGYEWINGERMGFIYDHFGILGQAKTVHPLTEWIPNLDGWSGSSCLAVNDQGQLVGYFADSVNGTRAGFYLDLDLFAAQPSPGWEYLPNPEGSTFYYGDNINSNGDVIIFSEVNGGPVNHAYLFNPAEFDPDAPQTFPSLVTDPATGAALSLKAQVSTNTLNASRQLVGRLTDGTGVRLTPGVQLESLPLAPTSINDAGLVAGAFGIQVPGKGKKTSTINVAARFSSVADPLTSLESFSNDINHEGDVAGRFATGSPLLFHADVGATAGHGLLDLNTLVVGTEDDLTHWFSATNQSALLLNDRDTTGFGQVVISSSAVQTTGKGKNRVTVTDNRLLILTPETPQP